MNEFYIRNVLEAALLAAGKPLQLAELGQLFDENVRPTTEDLRAALDALTSEYSSRGIEVKETAAGFRIQVRREFSAEISRLWPERPQRYSRALLETLALIAYRQPITRAEIEAVRGVAVNPNIVKTVIERNWVRVVGHRDVPGRPELLGTTREFLDYFGLRSLDELPPLAEIKSLGDFNPQLELTNGGASGATTSTAEGAAGGAEGAIPVAALAADGPSDAAVGQEAGVEFAHDLSAAGAGDAAGAGQAGDARGAGETLVAGAGPEVSAATDELVRDPGFDAATETLEAGAVPAHEEFAQADAAESGEGSDGGEASDGSGLVTDPSTQDVVAQGDELETEAAAERTLSAGEAPSDTAAADAEESEVSPQSSSASDSVDAIDDSADDEADDDELSADGHGSRELVAGPRDLND
jgi:segregation and condensation protein B